MEKQILLKNELHSKKIIEISIPLDVNLKENVKNNIINSYKEKLYTNVNILGKEMKVIEILWNDTKIVLKCKQN